MRAAFISAPGVVEVVERPDREPGPGEVQVATHAAGICGSDLLVFQGRNAAARPPRQPGHEASGVVAAVGAGVGLAPGTPVALMPIVSCRRCRFCREARFNLCPELSAIGGTLPGGMAETFFAPAANLRPLPPGLSLDAAALVEPTAVAVHAANQGEAGPSHSAAVLGAGVIGLLLLQVLRARGAGLLFASGRQETKLRLAHTLAGATTADATREDVVAAGRRLADGFDAVYDCIGTDASLADALRLVRPGGRIVLIAAAHEPPTLTFDYALLMRLEAQLLPAKIYDSDFDDAIPLLANGSVKAEPLISHRFPLDRAAAAFHTVERDRASAIKVLVHPSV